MKLQTQLFFILTLLLLLNQSTSICATQSSTLGCLTCPSTQKLILNLTSNKFVCTTLTGCLEITNNNCTSCQPGYLLDNSNNCVDNMYACQTLNQTANQCQTCIQGYIKISGNCTLKFFTNCDIDNIVLNSNGTDLICQKCLSRSLNPNLNCQEVDTTICSQFDFQTFRCIKCPNDLILSSNGDSCYSLIQNCESYNLQTGLCLQCRIGYIFSNTIGSCQPTSSLAVKSLIYTQNGSSLTPQYKCLDSTKIYDETTNSCQPTNLTAHCNDASCTTCLPGYYPLSNQTSNSSSCIDCTISLSNCALCSNNTICQVCNNQYYLLNTASTTSKCMPCSAYGCLHCWINSTDTQGIQCLSCPSGSTLYLGSCFTCPDGQSFSIQTGTCLNCSNISNCLQCQFTQNSLNSTTQTICLKCNSSYYLQTTINPNFSIPSTQCLNLTTQSAQWQNLIETDKQKYLSTLAPGIQQGLFNNRIGLMSSCTTQTDGYVCICSSLNLTSLCTNITNSLTISSFNQSSIKNLNQANLFRMLTEFPNFDFLNLTPDPSTSSTSTTNQFIITQYQLANYLAAATLASSRTTATNVLNIVNRVKTLTYIMQNNKIFNDQKITIIQGNGFYFKHIPKTLKSGSQGDDDFISTTSTITNNGTTSVTFYIQFDRDATITNVVTGKIYIFCKNLTSATVTVVAKKTRYVENTGALSVSLSGTASTLNITQNQGKYTIVGFSISNTTNPYIQVSVGVSTESQDPYSHQRIQNIFDSQSWIYILFFVVVYLVFIPFCSMVDCCETKQNLRKRVGTEQSDKESSEASTVVRVNYRQFFPLYNIGNTPRPRRLQKLCLFIVNMQHSVTFLTLIYFNFQGGHEVVAIVLVIPAYLCTIVMGYICGLIFRYLPNNFKYFINLFSLGYWIMWIFLMRIMSRNSSQAYWPYLLTFSILCNVLDIIIDSLEMLLVYFSLRQQQQQIQLYRCLARWLSWRGYYQYDKLSRQLGLENL